jgi:hypothetical protein
MATGTTTAKDKAEGTDDTKPDPAEENRKLSASAQAALDRANEDLDDQPFDDEDLIRAYAASGIVELTGVQRQRYRVRRDAVSHWYTAGESTMVHTVGGEAFQVTQTIDQVDRLLVAPLVGEV